MQVFKYSIKAFYSYDKSYFNELKSVVNLSVSSVLGSLYQIAKIRVARTAFKINPEYIKIECSHFDTTILKVSEVLRVDNKLVEIIAKTELNLPTSISKYGEFANLGVNSEFLGGLSTDTLLAAFDIESFDDIENKLKAIGVRFWCDSKGLKFDSEFGVKNEPVKSFDESDFLSFSVRAEQKERISEIIFNAKSENDIFAEPKITLVIDPSPQPVTPLRDITYTNEETGDKYIISPINAIGKIFTSINGSLTSNLELMVDENYTAVEEYELENEDILELAGFIKELKSVRVNDKEVPFVLKPNDEYSGNFYAENMLSFGLLQSGSVKVSYKTRCYFFKMPPCEKETERNILLNFYNSEIDFMHKYTLQGYYPKSYETKLSLIRDFNYDSGFIPNAKMKFRGQILSVDAFGEVDLKFADYGNYEVELLIDNVSVKKLYISYFANEFKKDFNVKVEE